MTQYESMISQLELFQSPLINANVESNKTLSYFPLAPLNSATQLDFFIPGGDTYIDLSSLQLKIKIRVCKEDNGQLVNIPNAETKVSLANLPMHSLFNQIDCFLNDTPVQSSHNCYPYFAYVSTILNYGEDAKNSYKSIEGYRHDEFPDPDEAFHADNLKNPRNGIAKRAKDIAISAPREYMGKLHIDICNVNKYLLNKVDVKLRLIKNSDDFIVISREDETFKYRVVIDEAIIYVRHLNINPDLQNAQNALLLKEPAVYDLTQTVVKTFSISAGARDLVRSNLFLGKIPNRVIICMMDNSAFNGSSKHNPFNFQHNELNYLQLTVNDRNLPEQILSPNFRKNLYSRSINTIFEALDLTGRNMGNCINYDNYKKGFTIWMFDLTPEHDANSPNLSIQKTGSMRLTLKFASPLTSIQNLVLLAEFENRLYINQDREVTYVTE